MYYCYWNDCDFAACGDISGYLADFEDARKKYVDDTLLPVEKNSIVLLYRNKKGCFPHAFIRQEDAIRRMDLSLHDNLFCTSLNTNEGNEINVEVRYTDTHGYNFKVYYMDIPDYMILYVENGSEMTIHIDYGIGTVHIAPGERKDITSGYVPDYLEFARYNTPLPKGMKRFETQHVLQELEHNGLNHPENSYMMIRDWHATNGGNVSDERISMIASRGVEPVDSAWIPLFIEFPDKRKDVICKIFAYYQSSIQWCETDKRIRAFWELYQKYEEVDLQKETIVWLIRQYLEDICSSEGQLDGLLSMLLADIKSFGNTGLWLRDASMRILLTQNRVVMWVLKELLKTDFVPLIYLDEYMENVAHSDNRYLMPLLISVKFAERRGKTLRRFESINENMPPFCTVPIYYYTDDVSLWESKEHISALFFHICTKKRSLWNSVWRR